MSEIDGLKLLKRIDERVAGKTGESFFRGIVQELATALDAHAAFAGRLDADSSATMLAFRVGDEFRPCTTYKLEGTPCAFVYQGRISAYATGIRELFPVDAEWFDQLGVKSYLGVPFKDDSGKVVGHLAVMDTRERDWHEADIDALRLFSLRCAAETERGRYEARLEQANVELQQEIARRVVIETELTAARAVAEAANQAKNVFISNMSHELRTPLNGIIGYTQLLQKDGTTLTAAQCAGLGVIESSGQHLLALINDLLDLAKIEAGRIELDEQAIDLNLLLQEISDLVRMRAAASVREFTVELAEDMPRGVRADSRALRQVLLNLLGNALKFTDRDGRVQLSVQVSAVTVTQATIEFVITDSGIGIAADQLDRIFEPFTRVLNEQRTVEGTGLGLAICRRLVNAMGGQIAVASTLGAGSRFTVSLPLAITTAPAQSTADLRISGYHGPQRQVLIADDDAVNLRLVRHFLRELGFKVHCVGDGSAALATLISAPPDLLITDMRMPMMDGLELVRAWRAQEIGTRLPALAISASADKVSAEQAIASGCDAFLTKPLQLSQLLEQIGQLLELRWIEHEAVSAKIDQATNAGYTLEPDLATQLYELAQRGDVLALNAAADAALAGNPAAATVLKQLRALAAQFDMRGMRQLLTGHLPVTAARAEGRVAPTGHS